MKGFHANIEEETKNNPWFRKVIYTAKHTQLVLMSIPPGGEIGAEVHKGIDQFFRVDKGEGKCMINGNEYMISDGDAIIVPSGAEHNIINTSRTEHLKLYTLYSPPHHKDGTLHATKEDADIDEEEFDGKTTE